MLPQMDNLCLIDNNLHNKNKSPLKRPNHNALFKLKNKYISIKSNDNLLIQIHLRNKVNKKSIKQLNGSFICSILK